MTAALSLWRSQLTVQTRHEKARTVIAEVAKRHGLTVDQIMSNRRLKKIAHARFQAWWIMRIEMGWSFPKIGRLFDKDHTSVLHGVRRWPTIAAEMAEAA